jgi:hypothetical protein
MRTFTEVKKCFWTGEKLGIKSQPDVKILTIDETTYRSASKSVKCILAHKDNTGFTWVDLVRIRDIVKNLS